MKLHIPTTQAELLEPFGGGDEAEDVSPLGEVDDTRFWHAVEIVRGLASDDHTMTLARDWEGCVFGLVLRDSEDVPYAPFDVLAFTHDGHVGHGGVNMPNYMDPETFANTVKEEASR